MRHSLKAITQLWLHFRVHVQTCRRRAKSGILISTALLLVACGGDGDDEVRISLDAAVGGLWQGTTIISEQGTFALIGFVAEDGRAYFLQDDGVMYWGTVESAAKELTSEFNGAVLFGMPFWDDSFSGTGALNGTIRARDSVSANSTFTTRYGSRTTSTISLTYVPMYEEDSSLDVIAGTYTSANGYVEGVLNIASSGELFLQDPYSGCIVNGQVGLIDTDYNAYDVTFSYSSCEDADSAFNGVTFSGLATFDRDTSELIAFVTGTVDGRPYPDVFVFERQ